MLTFKERVSGVVPRKQLAGVSDDAKTWKEELIMEKKEKRIKERSEIMGLNMSACTALLLHVRLTKGNNWSKKKHLRAEMKCGTEGQNAQFIGNFTVSKYLQLF